MADLGWGRPRWGRNSTENDPRVDLMELRGSPLGEDIFQYLMSRNAMPEVRRTSSLGYGTLGQYTRFGTGIPSNGLLELTYGSGPNTTQHEFTHAADSALAHQYSDRQMYFGSPAVPTQFTEAFDKLVGGTTNAYEASGYKGNMHKREELAQKIDPEWYEKNKGYRAKNRELAGWGSGNMRDSSSSMKDEYKPPNHIDATMATELSILLDLARRADKPRPEPPSITSRVFDWINSLRK